jgi:hypothetical protein
MLNRDLHRRRTMKKKFFRTICCAFLLGSLLPFQSLVASASDDITGIKLESEMREMIGVGVIKGYGDGIYKPFDAVTRGQFATMIDRALSLPDGAATFPDVPTTSALATGIYSASAAGIVNGYTDGTFRMDEPITRDQVAKMIDNALTYLKVEKTTTELTFNDTADIYEEFKEAVAHNVAAGIIKGIPNSDGTSSFAPKKTATRAEASAFITRLMTAGNVVIAQPPAEDPHVSHHPIMGTSVVSAEKMAAFVKAQNPTAQDIDEIAAAFIEIGNKYGVRGDVAFAQSILETGWFKYEGGTAVTPDQHNYAGLGVTSKGVKGNIFPTVREGVTAQIQHLFAYASTAPVPAGEVIVDLRFKYVSPRGKAPHWEDLSMKWAMSADYGNNILSIYNRMKNS